MPVRRPVARHHGAVTFVELLVEMFVGAGRVRGRSRPVAGSRRSRPPAPGCQLQPCPNASVTAYHVRDDLPWAWVCRDHLDALAGDSALRASLLPSSR
jgi:hypothetical protein